MYCKECGAEIPDDSKHCKECGAKLIDIAPKNESKMNQYSLIAGVIGGITSFYCIMGISMSIVPPTLIGLGVLFSFISIFAVYLIYKQQKYGKVILIISIFVLFLCGREFNFLGLLLLIVSLILSYFE